MKKLKIEDQVLTREQMAHLEELGVDTSDASMAYYNISREGEPDKWLLGIANEAIAATMLVNGFTDMQPAYTIGDLIEKLPKETEDGDTLLFEFGAHDIGYGSWDSYDITGGELDFRELYDISHRYNFKDRPLKDVLYELLREVIETKLITLFSNQENGRS